MDPDNIIRYGISVDADNPKYRQYQSGGSILEYTLDDEEITIDWISGSNASTMIKAVLDADGDGVTRIAGYVTDRLGRASDDALQRLGSRIARQLGVDWKATIELIEGRRHLVFMKRGR